MVVGKLDFFSVNLHPKNKRKTKWEQQQQQQNIYNSRMAVAFN